MTGIPVGVAAPMADATELTTFARAVEDHGLDHVSLSDVLLGDGTPSLDTVLAAAAVATATSRVGVEFGVLVLPLRDPVWTAHQLATLQHLSGDRIVLGVGIGGFPGTPFWRAVGAPERRRGGVLDATLDRLPGLLAGTDPDVTLAPAATMPPVLVGGGATAVARANRHGAGWFPSLVAPADVAEHAGSVTSGRVHIGMHAALGRDRENAHARLVCTLVDGMGFDPARAEAVTVVGGTGELAERIVAHTRAGATSVTLALDGADPSAQLTMVAEARERARSELSGAGDSR